VTSRDFVSRGSGRQTADICPCVVLCWRSPEAYGHLFLFSMDGFESQSELRSLLERLRGTEQEF
jgi:hypothetical protein